MATLCLDCRRRIASGSRCARCSKRRQDARNAARGGSGWAWQQERQASLDAHGHRCAQCGAPCPHDGRPARPCWDVDHEVPLAEGGRTEPANLRPLCDSCHLAKTTAQRRRAGRRGGAR